MRCQQSKSAVRKAYVRLSQISHLRSKLRILLVADYRLIFSKFNAQYVSDATLSWLGVGQMAMGLWLFLKRNGHANARLLILKRAGKTLTCSGNLEI